MQQQTLAPGREDLGRSRGPSRGSVLLRRLRQWRDPRVVVGAALLIQVVVLSVMTRRVWFFADDWDFLLTRGTIPGESRGWFEAHNDHWSTAVVLIYRALFSVFGLEHYWAFAAVLIAMHVAVGSLVCLLLVRVGTPRWTAAALTCLVVFSGVGSEAMLWLITLSLVGSLLCGLAALLLLLRGGSGFRGLLGVWVLLVAGLTFSGGGIASVCLVAVFAACHWNLRRGALIASVPAAVFTLWFVAIGHEGGSEGPGSVWQLARIPGLVWTGLGTCMERASGVPSSGALILLLLLGGAFLLPGPEALRHLAWAGVVAAIVNSALVAGFRLSAGEQSRYFYVVLVFFLPALALWVLWASAHLRGPRPARVVLVAALLAAYVVNALHLEYKQFRVHENNTAHVPALAVGIVTSLDDGEQMLNQVSGQWFNADFRADLIGRREIREALPDVEPTAAGRLDAERWFFVDVGEEGHGLPGPTTLSFGQGYPEPGSRPAQGCHVQNDTALRTTLTMPTGNGAEISVSSRSARVTTTLERGNTTSKARTWEVEPGTIHVSTTARNAELEVTLERDGGDGDVVICAR